METKSTIIFETPTRKGWLTIHEVIGVFTLWIVQLADEKEINKDRLVAHRSEHSNEMEARVFAQGLYIGVEIS